MTRRSWGLTDLLRFSCPGCLESPDVLPLIVLLLISSAAFLRCELLVYCHADWLDRFAFGCGNNASLAYARGVCSKPHSQGPDASFPWVLSFLSSDLFTIFHTAVPLSAYASEAIVPQDAYGLVACSLYRPPMRAALWLSRSDVCFAHTLDGCCPPETFLNGMNRRNKSAPSHDPVARDHAVSFPFGQACYPALAWSQSRWVHYTFDR